MSGRKQAEFQLTGQARVDFETRVRRAQEVETFADKQMSLDSRLAGILKVIDASGSETASKQVAAFQIRAEEFRNLNHTLRAKLTWARSVAADPTRENDQRLQAALDEMDRISDRVRAMGPSLDAALNDILATVRKAVASDAFQLKQLDQARSDALKKVQADLSNARNVQNFRNAADLEQRAAGLVDRIIQMHRQGCSDADASACRAAADTLIDDAANAAFANARRTKALTIMVEVFEQGGLQRIVLEDNQPMDRNVRYVAEMRGDGVEVFERPVRLKVEAEREDRVSMDMFGQADGEGGLHLEPSPVCYRSLPGLLDMMSKKGARVERMWQEDPNKPGSYIEIAVPIPADVDVSSGHEHSGEREV